MGQKPWGIKPTYIRNKDRMLEIQRAINRYMAEQLQVPNEWIREYNSLAELLKQ